MKKHKHLLVLGLLFLFSCQVMAQLQQAGQIRVLNKELKPIVLANVFFQTKATPKDTLSIKKAQRFVTDSNGAVKITADPTKSYSLKISAVGYQSVDTSLVFSNQQQLSFILKEYTALLGEVVVKSSKVLIRQEDDKSVVDPELLAASSTNAFETIEKVPGIFIDQDGQVYLNGLSPANIQINGRDLKMSASDIAILLKSLPPNAIQKIELIRTPSAKYDASGGGGVVNIVLMKGIKLGVNGSISTGINQGVYGNEYLGVNLSNNNDKLSSYINTQYSNNNGYSITNTNRMLSLDTMLGQKARTLSPNNSFYIGYGFGKNLKEKWELNYDGRFSNQNFENKTVSTSILQNILNKGSLSNVLSDVNNQGDNLSLNQSFRIKNKLDTSGGEWVSDISYNFSSTKTDQSYSNQISTLQLSAPIGSMGSGDFGNDKKTFVLQTDFKKKIAGITLESGLKSSALSFTNTSNYIKNIAGVATADLFRTSAYVYKEQINAAYLQGSKKWGKIILKVGSRVEQTIMEGHQQVPKDTTFSLNRTDAFPYVYLSRYLVSIANYEVRGFLVYRKTISRPSYEYLNPFPKYVDPFLYEIGNPTLKPQFTSNYEANISVDDKPLFAIGVNETKDIFTSVVYQSSANKQIAYRTYDNLGKNKETYFRVVGVIPPGKKYFAVLGTQYNRNKYTGFYEGKPISFDKGTWSFFTFQSYKIDALSVLTLNGFWRTNGQQQFYELENFGSINMTVNRQFLNKKLVVTASVNDLFFTSNNRFVLHQGSMNAYGYRESDSKRYGLSLRYSFGIKPKENKLEMFDVGNENK